MNVSRWVTPLASVGVLLAAVPIADAAGWWVSSGQTAVVEDQLTVDGVKGWMTVQHVADGLGVSVADVVAAIGPPTGVTVPPGTVLKDLEALVPGFSVPALREALASRVGGGGTPAPSPAAT